jgi:hypothetical protein
LPAPPQTGGRLQLGAFFLGVKSKQLSRLLDEQRAFTSAKSIKPVRDAKQN